MLHLLSKGFISSKSATDSYGSDCENDDLESLIVNRRWYHLLARIVAATGAGTSKNKIEMLMDLGDSGENVLHRVCRYHPTPEVVELIIHELPTAIYQTNDQGQYPIHCAAEWGACPKVIRILSDRCRDTLKIQDNQGRTPLHLACNDYCDNYKYSQGAVVLQMREAVAQTIKILTKKCPTVVNIEDNEEVTALEYAVLNAFIDLDTIQCIQRASCRRWKQTQVTRRRPSTASFKSDQATRRRASTDSCKNDWLKVLCREHSCNTVATEADYGSHEESGLPWEEKGV